MFLRLGLGREHRLRALGHTGDMKEKNFYQVEF